AMNNTFLMGGGERITEGARNFDDLLDWESALRNQAIHRDTFHELHGEKVNAVALFHRVDRNNVRMVKLGENPGFPAKACEAFRILSHFSGQDFERYIASQLRVCGAIHFAHSAHTER